jgi:beta-glucosidase
VRWTGSFIAPESGETHFYLFNTGLGQVWLDGELLVENNIGTITSAEVDYETMAKRATVSLEKGRRYTFKAEFTSGENSQYALMRLHYMPPLNAGENMLEEAVKLAGESDAVVIVAGLPDGFESEGMDRPHMDLPGDQDALIRAVAAANPNTVVVVNAGAPVTMPWVDTVPAVLLSYYPGQEGGHALADLLFGDANPSGKLTVSFPEKLADNPAFTHYPGWKNVHYGEGLFVGYRYYDAKGVRPLFPFGHGLSYTTFAYRNLQVPDEVKAGETFQVSLTVENTGNVPGKEVVQLYVADQQATLIRPPKELKGFAKVDLAPGEEKTVTFELDPRALSFYEPHQGAWVAEPGGFEILIGASSGDIRLRKGFELV